TLARLSPKSAPPQRFRDSVGKKGWAGRGADVGVGAVMDAGVGAGCSVASWVMRMSELFLRTLREDPADAEVDSHRLLLRAGYIRRVSAGLDAWLPVGRRVMHKGSEIVRQEMDRAGAQEVSLPIAQPIELWERTGRSAAYGDLMFRLHDRKDAGYCLSPTAE